LPEALFLPNGCRLAAGWARRCRNLRGIQQTAHVIKNKVRDILKEIELNFNYHDLTLFTF
jgi:hypothetical protein